MRNIYLLLLVSLPMYCYSQADPCDIDSAAYRYYFNDAAMLTQLEIQQDTLNAYHDSIHIPRMLINNNLKPLCYFYQSTGPQRDSVINIYNIHKYCGPYTGIGLYLDTSLLWVRQYINDSLLSGNPQFDSLVTGNGFKLRSVYHFNNFYSVTLFTDSILNQPPLLVKLQQIPGVFMASGGGCIGDGDRIELDHGNTNTILTFSIGWDDCPSGCIFRHYWRFHITPLCDAVFDSSWGQPPYFVGQKPVAKFTVSDDTICANECVQFYDSSTNGPTQWKWYFQDGVPSTSNLQNPIVCYLDSGKFDVKIVVTNLYGSDSVSKYIHVNPSPPVPNMNMKHDTLFCSVDTSYVLYQWYMEDSLLSEGPDDTLLVITQSGNYNVAVTNRYNCTVAVGINPWGIRDYALENSIIVFPNPAENQLVVSSRQLADNNATIRIYNMLGQETSPPTPLQRRGEGALIDVSTLPSGIYFLQLKTESGVAVKKFVKSY